MPRRAAILLTGLVCGLAGLVPPASAIVYTLKPGTGVKDVAALVQGKEVIEEVLEVNGMRGRLEVMTSDLTMPEIVAGLKAIVQNYRPAGRPGAILLEQPMEGVWSIRYLIMQLGEEHKTVIFTMKIPRQALHNKDASRWPDELPQPTASSLGPVLRLGKRGAILAQWQAGEAGDQVAARYASSLIAEGWNLVEGSPREGGTYRHPQKKAMAVLSVHDDGTKTTAAVYYTPIDKVKGQ